MSKISYPSPTSRLTAFAGLLLLIAGLAIRAGAVSNIPRGIYGEIILALAMLALLVSKSFNTQVEAKYPQNESEELTLKRLIWFERIGLTLMTLSAAGIMFTGIRNSLSKLIILAAIFLIGLFFQVTATVLYRPFLEFPKEKP